MERKCKCGKVVSSEDAAFCPECGSRLAESPDQAAAGSNGSPQHQPAGRPDAGVQRDRQPAPQPRCEACGTAWDEDHRFCPECGEPAGGGQPTTKLVIYTPDGDKKEVRLDGSTLVIGKNADATVRLDDPYVSRKHCRFVATGSGGYQLEDMGSRNGTFVKLTEPAPVSPGTTFMVGKCLVRVEEE